MNETVKKEPIVAEVITEALQKEIRLGASSERVAIEITGACGGRCFQCYADKLRQFGNMEESDIYASIDGASQASFQEAYIVGGEPMLHPKVEDACGYSKEKDLYTILVTTGYGLSNPERAEKILKKTDKVEVSIRSLYPEVHNNVVLGKGWERKKPEKAPKMGGFGEAIKALKVLTKKREEIGVETKLAVNFDLYKQPEDFDGHGMAYAIVKMLNEQGIKLDGFYVQLIDKSGRAADNWEYIAQEVQVDKQGLIQALQDLKAVHDEFGIEDVSMTDDPVAIGIIQSKDEIPGELRDLVIGEVVPAIAPNGEVRRNVVEL